MRTIVVVGASLAGLRAAETLRQEGYDGRLVLVGAEEHLPYDRPPLSKQFLAGTCTLEQIALRREPYDDLRLALELGRRATALDLAAREVVVDDRDRISFDGLVIATGATPRHLPGTPPLEGIHVLRTLDDSLAVRADLDRVLASGGRAVVVGAGFIGSEVAATCRSAGANVTVLEALAMPLSRALGEQMGAACAALHHDNGVDLRTGAGVSGFLGTHRVEGVLLHDGTVVEAELVVVGVGVTPNTAWLESSGLTLRDGVVCDATCLAAPGVVAAGDVARWHNELFDTDMRVEHWTNAAEQGMAAARTLLAGPDAAVPFAPVPYFWSDQYKTKIQFVGHAHHADDVRVVDGSIEARKFVALYEHAGRLVGALAFSRPKPLLAARRLIAERATISEAVAQLAS
ncbi:MAG: pyridine nucleotide-disulfide oxidoreductase [Acidimicrobiales bacterium]|nr:pyridine nucleotide-disulfide oxidoreductase [Acidimicrobiales bacterium]